MKQSIQEIIDKGNLSPGLEKKIQSYAAYEKRYLSGKGGRVFGGTAMKIYEAEIIARANEEA